MKFLPYSIDTTKSLFIYLPGMDGSGELLASQKQIWENFDVRCVYIPSQQVGWRKLAEQLQTLIKEELRANGVRKVYLCGESFGACLALKFLELSTDLVDEVILINCASAFPQRPLLNLGTYATQLMSNLIYQNSTFLLLPFLGKLEFIDSVEKDRLLSAMQAVPPQTVSWRLSLLNNFSYPLTSFPFCGLIVASGEDQLLPSITEAQKLKRLFAEAKIVILPNSGHCCLLENKIDLYKIITHNQNKQFSQHTNHN